MSIFDEIEKGGSQRRQEVVDNLNEKELLQMIAKDTSRTAKNVAFYFWITMILVCFSVLAVVAEIIFGAAMFPG